MRKFAFVAVAAVVLALVLWIGRESSGGGARAAVVVTGSAPEDERGPATEPPSAAASSASVERAPVSGGADGESEGRLRGRVTSVKGAALIGAQVMLLRSSDGQSFDERSELLERTVSGAEGRFSFADPQDRANLFVVANAAGYSDGAAPVETDGELRIALQPATRSVTITGRVVDGEQLVPDFEVAQQIWVTRPDGGTGSARRWIPVHQSEPGFSVALDTSSGSDQLHFMVRAQGYLDAARTLRPTGDEVDAGEIPLTRRDEYTGIVVDAANRPIGGARVAGILEHGGSGTSAITGAADGCFTLPMAAGVVPVALSVSAAGFAMRVVRREEVGGVWNGVTIRLTSGARVDGHVAFADGRSAAGVDVIAWLVQSGEELPGGAMGGALWSRATKTDRDGLYHLEQVPCGSVAIGVSLAGTEAPLVLRRIQSLVVADAPLYACDFALGGGRSVRGSIEFPKVGAPGGQPIFLELCANGGSLPGVLASMEVVAGAPFVFEDVPIDPSGASLVLRISVGPGFHVERKLEVEGESADIGAIRFPTFESLMEFNQGERKIFVRGPPATR